MPGLCRADAAPLQPLRLDPDEAQFSFDNLKQSLIVMLQEREQKATTDAEKEKIKKRRIDLQACCTPGSGISSI